MEIESFLLQLYETLGFQDEAISPDTRLGEIAARIDVIKQSKRSI